MIGRLSAATVSGGFSSRVLAPGEVGFLITKLGDGLGYGFSTESAALPGGLQGIDAWAGDADGWSFWPPTHYDNYEAGLMKQLFGQRLDVVASGGNAGPNPQSFTNDYKRETVSGNLGWISANFTYDVGYSYVAMGEWSFKVLDPTGHAGAAGDTGSLLFVNGDRTPSPGIPVSGTATYDARGLNFVNGPFTLTADFSQRTIAALIDQDYRYNPADPDILDYPLAHGIHVSGSAPFTNDGLFNVPLSGTVNWSNGYVTNSPQTPPAEPVTGMINGAFFGPSAEQVGGTLFLNQSGGVQRMQDAFVGQQRKP